MKIRTFLICEDIDLSPAGDIVIKNMMRGISAKYFPTEEKVVVLITLENQLEKPGELSFITLNSKGKPLYEHAVFLEKGKDVIVTNIELRFPESDEYSIKLQFDGEHVGKYRFLVRQFKESEMIAT